MCGDPSAILPETVNDSAINLDDDEEEGAASKQFMVRKFSQLCHETDTSEAKFFYLKTILSTKMLFFRR